MQKDRDIYNLGLPWMTKWSNLPKFTTRTSTAYCGPCCDNSQVDFENAKAIVLCCIDFRLRDNQSCHLNRLGYKNNYDEVIGAGASLAYNNKLTGYENASWNVYINSHFDLSRNLHSINEIIIVEHEKCGAYKITYADIDGNFQYSEITYHITNVNEAGETIWSLYNPKNGTNITTIPDLKIIGYYLTINASELKKIYEKKYNSDGIVSTWSIDPTSV
jgi:hypothetical protein